MIIHSPAKINLFLKVLRKREDGYHDIITVMQPVSIYDEIVLDVTDCCGISIVSDNENIPSDKNNLAYKAAEIFLKKTGITKGIHIKIKKSIPVAAGLGGGSSNAASVLIGLNKLLNARISKDNLMEISSKLGSDCPFFIHGGSVIAEGRGEKITGIEIPKFRYIVINPGFPVSTAWVYGNLPLTKMQEDINIINLKNRLASSRIENVLKNDLEAVTINKYPDIEKIKCYLKKIGAIGTLMSGSGATVFGIFKDEGAVKSAYNCIKDDPMFKDMAVFEAQGCSATTVNN